MPANFPQIPTVGQVYTYADRSWEWDGSGWRAKKGGVALDSDRLGGLLPSAYLRSFSGVPWIYPTLQNGWTNFGNARAPTRYRKSGDLVHLQLALTGGSANTMFTMPAGYYDPSYIKILPAVRQIDAGTIGGTGIVVDTGGGVQRFATSEGNLQFVLDYLYLVGG